MQNELPLVRVSFVLTAKSFDVNFESTPVGSAFESLIAYLRNMVDEHNDAFCTAFYSDLERLESEENGKCTC